MLTSFSVCIFAKKLDGALYSILCRLFVLLTNLRFSIGLHLDSLNDPENIFTIIDTNTSWSLGSLGSLN